MTRQQFIAEHIKNCKAMPCKKYDPKKPNAGLHTLAYSRRKCAANLWRRAHSHQRELTAAE